MGQFIEQVEKNNRLQVQELSYKKQVQKQKEEAKRKREEEKQQKLLYNQLLIDTQIFFEKLINEEYKNNNYNQAFLNLNSNYYIITKKYIDLQALSLESEYKTNLYFLECKKIFDSLNMKYFNNSKRIENIQSKLIKEEETEEEKTSVLKSILNIWLNFSNTFWSFFGGACAGFTYGLIKDKPKRKRK